MSPRQKLLYLGLVPIGAATIGGAATYLSTPSNHEQVIVTGEAARAAKNGKLIIEVVRRDETDYSWIKIFAMPLMFVGLATMYWAMNRQQ